MFFHGDSHLPHLKSQDLGPEAPWQPAHRGSGEHFDDHQCHSHVVSWEELADAIVDVGIDHEADKGEVSQNPRC